MKTSLLQLERVLLRSLLIEGSQSGSLRGAARKANDCELKFQVQKNQEASRIRVRVQLAINNTCRPDIRSVRLDAEAIFQFPDGADGEVVKQYVPKVCIANAIGIIRGLVAQSTAHCENGPYWFPLINVQESLAVIRPDGGKRSEGIQKKSATRVKAKAASATRTRTCK